MRELDGDRVISKPNLSCETQSYRFLFFCMEVHQISEHGIVGGEYGGVRERERSEGNNSNADT